MSAHGVPDDDAVAARLTALRHDHLVAPCAAPPVVGGGLPDEAVGPSLAAVRRVRVPLTDGEAATVAIPLARALDALHAAGLVCEPPAASDVVFAPDGRPRLIVRRPRAAVPGEEGDDDLRGLLATVLEAMAPSLVLPAVSDDEWAEWADDEPALRPVLDALLAGPRFSGEDVARACFDAVRPEPVRLPDAGALARAALLGPEGAAHGPVAAPNGGAARRLPRRAAGGRLGSRLPGLEPVTRRALRQRSRRRVRLGAGALVVLGLLAAAVAVARPDGAVRAQGTSATGEAAVVVDPVHDPSAPADAAAALTRRRAAALAAGDPAALDGVDLAGGPARAADEALLAGLGGDRIVGLGVDVRGAEVVGATGSGAAGGGAAGDGAAGDGMAGDGAEGDRTGAHGGAEVGGAADGEGEVRVAVTAAMGPYTRVATDGGTTQVPGTTPRTVVLALGWTEDGWRVREVSSPSATG